jgi:DNA repair exonuclease SbcCD ATPase subunit
MITLKTLKWNNCFSYGADNEIDLSGSTLTQIIGTNGMGKSSIPLIIEEALYNKNSKGIKKADIPNRYVNDGYDIYLSFQKEDSLYEITINRKTNIKVKLEENGVDISSHTATNTYKTVQEILGIDFKTFSQLVYQNTNSSLQFLTATDTNRKKFLIDLLHLEEYVKLFEVFKEAAKDASSKVTSVESTIATIEKWLSENKLSDTSILPLLEIKIDTEEDEKELRSLTIELQNISEKNKKISENNKLIEILRSINIDEANKISATEILSYDSLQSEAGSLKGTIASSNSVLKKLEGLGDNCPTCEQSIDADFKQSLIDAETARAKEAKEKLENEINPEIERIKVNNSEYERKANIQSNWERTYKAIDRNLPTTQVDRNELDRRIQGVSDRISEAKKALADVSAENEKRTRRNTRIQVIQEQTQEFIDQLSEAEAVLAEQVELNSNLEILKKAFSTNGLLAYKIENLVKELEELVNSYLGELSDGRFTLEFVVSNDKLNVQVTDNGNIIDILALSSGELARVNTATLIAIRKLMSSISKSKLNILFLDEVINVLDESGREKLVEVLLGEEELNTYVVSHGWTHPLLEKIEITKKGSISVLE